MRDATLGEDACRVHTGHAPHALAALRNGVVDLLHRLAMPQLATALRTYAWQPTALFRLLGLSLTGYLKDRAGGIESLGMILAKPYNRPASQHSSYRVFRCMRTQVC